MSSITTEALAFINKQQEEPEHFRLDYFTVQSGSSDIATASVKLACGDEIKAEAANGNGPVDAIYRAINRVTEYDVELVKYDLTAKGHGKDAPGQLISSSTTTVAASTVWVWRQISSNPPRKRWCMS